MDELILYCIFVYFKNMADKMQPFTRYVNKIKTKILLLKSLQCTGVRWQIL